MNYMRTADFTKMNQSVLSRTYSNTSVIPALDGE